MKLPSARSLVVLVLALALVACGGGGGAPAETAAKTDPAEGELRDATPEPLDHWTKLGERVLSEDAKHDSIRSSADAGRFGSIRFVLKFGKLELTRVKVTYDDGTAFVTSRRIAFGDGVTSRAIDIPGAKRPIRQIDFDYGGLRAGRSTQLEIWAAP